MTTTAPTTAAPAANPAPAAGKGNGKPCFEFSKSGQCKYAADCKFSHVKGEAKPAASAPTGAWARPAAPEAAGNGAEAPARGSGGARRGGRGGRAGGNAPLRLKKPCKRFEAGEECPYGAECHFSHDPEGDKKKFLVAQAKRTIDDKKQPCVWLVKGVVCPHGKICRHSHDLNDAKAPAAAAAKPAAAAPAPTAAAPAPAAADAATEQRAPAPAAAHPPAKPTAPKAAPPVNAQIHGQPQHQKAPKPQPVAGGVKHHRANHQLQQPKH